MDIMECVVRLAVEAKRREKVQERESTAGQGQACKSVSEKRSCLRRPERRALTNKT